MAPTNMLMLGVALTHPLLCPCPGLVSPAVVVFSLPCPLTLNPEGQGQAGPPRRQSKIEKNLNNARQRVPTQAQAGHSQDNSVRDFSRSVQDYRLLSTHLECTPGIKRWE